MQLFNSLTRSKEDFKTFVPHEVSMYICGITPDNATHVGHAFTYVSFDVLVRYLRHKGYRVNYLQNATDINDSDDVIKQAQIAGRTWQEEAAYWIRHFHKQMDALGVLRPTSFVLASSVIDTIIEIVGCLVQKGFAYEKNGSVYFDISKFPKYGELSRFSADQMLYVSRERGNNPDDPNKKNPLDFVLWQAVDADPSWESPWPGDPRKTDRGGHGKGRPGWHIECTAMIHKFLAPQIDIHGGGRDLMYPHHESEIAQSESYTGKAFVNTWMHTAVVLYEGEKMSKSLGNLVLVSNLLKRYSAQAIRWYMLSHHYRAVWEFEEFELEEIEGRIKNLRSLILDIRKEEKKQFNNEAVQQCESYMDDDLNTPKVLDLVEELARTNKKQEAIQILNILGFEFKKASL